MPARYYLMNGKNGDSRALKLLTKDGLKRDFIDISTLDLITMDIKDKDKIEVLREYNKDANLNGMFYDASAPHSNNQIKPYLPVFDMTNEKTKYYMEKLRYFAEQRNFKKQHGMIVQLDENAELENYIYKIMSSILNGYKPNFTSYDSLLATKIKDTLSDGYKYKSDSIRFINGRFYVLRNLFSNYTQLRIVTIEYMNYLNGNTIRLRNDLGRTIHYSNEDMEPLHNPQFEQLTLDKFMDMEPKKLKKTIE